jgi:hypothetical protein
MKEQNQIFKNKEPFRMHKNPLSILNPDTGRQGASAMLRLGIWPFLLIGITPMVTFVTPETHAGPNVEQVLTDLPLSDGDKHQIMEGEIVQWTSTESSEREVVVGKALLVRGKQPSETIKIFRQAIGLTLDPDVRAFGKIAGKGTTTDFAKVMLEPNGESESERYLEAEPGDELNLSSQEISGLKALNVKGQSAADKKKVVEKLLRNQLLSRYQSYHAEGLTGIPPYARGRGKEVWAADELVEATLAAKVLAKHAPAFFEVLLKYPDVKPPSLEEWYYWVNYEVSSRPNFILLHRLALQAADSFIVGERHFFVSHEYNSLQAVGGLLSAKEGTLVIYLYRVSTDKVAGFGSSIKRAAARMLMGKPIRRLFEKLRAVAENG